MPRRSTQNADDWIELVAFELGRALRVTRDAIATYAPRPRLARPSTAGRQADQRPQTTRTTTWTKWFGWTKGSKRSKAPKRRGERRTVRRSRDPAVSGLSAALEADDPADRIRAVELAGELSPSAAEPLVARALHDAEPAVRCAAAAAAARGRLAGVVFALILALDDRDGEVRTASARAIETITGHPLEFDPLSDTAERSEQIAALKQRWKEQRFEQLADQHGARGTK